MESKQNTLRSQTVRCPHCGEYYSVTYKYCPFCDAARKEEERKIKEKRQRRKSMFTGLFTGFEAEQQEEPERRKRPAGAPPKKKESAPKETAPHKERPRYEADYEDRYGGSGSHSKSSHSKQNTHDRSAGTDTPVWSDPPGGIDLYAEDGFKLRKKEPARKPKSAESAHKDGSHKEPSKSGKKKDPRKEPVRKEAHTKDGAAHEMARKKETAHKDSAHKEPVKKETARKEPETKITVKTEKPAKPVKPEKPKKTSFWNRGGRRPTSQLNEEEKAARLADREARAAQRKKERERAARAAAAAAGPHLDLGPVFEADTVPESFGFPETEETKTDPAAFAQAPVTEEGPVVETDPNAAAIEDIPAFIPPEMEKEAAAVSEALEAEASEAPAAETLPEEEPPQAEPEAEPQAEPEEERPLTEEEAADEAERSRWEYMRTMEQGNPDAPVVEVANGMMGEEVTMPEGLEEPVPADLMAGQEPEQPVYQPEYPPMDSPAAPAETQMEPEEETVPETEEDLDAFLNEIHSMLEGSPVPKLSQEELTEEESPVAEVTAPVAPEMPVSQDIGEVSQAEAPQWTDLSTQQEDQEDDAVQPDLSIGKEWTPPVEPTVPVDYGEDFYTPMEDFDDSLTQPVPPLDEAEKALSFEEPTQPVPTVEELLQEMRRNQQLAGLSAEDEPTQVMPQEPDLEPTQVIPSVDEVLHKEQDHQPMEPSEEEPTQALSFDAEPTQAVPTIEELLEEIKRDQQEEPAAEEPTQRITTEKSSVQGPSFEDELSQAMRTEHQTGDSSSFEDELAEAMNFAAHLTKEEADQKDLADSEGSAETAAPDQAEEPAEEAEPPKKSAKESRREARKRKKEERRKQKEQAALAALANLEDDDEDEDMIPETVPDQAEDSEAPTGSTEAESETEAGTETDQEASEAPAEETPVKESRREARKRKKEERRKQKEQEKLEAEEDDDLETELDEEAEEDFELDQPQKKRKANLPIILVALAIVAVAFFVISHSLAPGFLQNLFHHAEAESLILSEDTVTFTEANMTAQLSVGFAPEGAKPVEVSWASSNKEVATVDNNGLVTAVAPGAASVTASMEGGASVVCAVKCSWGEPTQQQPVQPPAEAAPEGTAPEGEAPADQPAAGLTLSSTDITLDGEGKTMKLELTGAEGAVKWTSSKDSIAKVDNDGTITAVGKGSATVTAEVNGESVRCAVRCIW